MMKEVEKLGRNTQSDREGNKSHGWVTQEGSSIEGVKPDSIQHVAAEGQRLPSTTLAVSHAARVRELTVRYVESKVCTATSHHGSLGRELHSPKPVSPSMT